MVTAFSVQGNTLLDPAALQALLQRWLGPRTLAELGQAAQAVQTQYSRAGYGAVVAYLPPQPVADGTVTIAVLEGRLSRVSVQGHAESVENAASETTLADATAHIIGTDRHGACIFAHARKGTDASRVRTLVMWRPAHASEPTAASEIRHDLRINGIENQGRSSPSCS